MILLTGPNGFLSGIIKKHISTPFITIGRTASDIICNLSLAIPECPAAEMVIHTAGKAHCIPKTEKEKQEFFAVNVLGTKNLLKGLERACSLPKSFVFISSIAVYGLDSGVNINEDRPLIAKDPYGLSKIKAENIVMEWCAKNNIICTVLRLPLIAGVNPPGNLGAMIKAIKYGYYFGIAGGKAKKSIVLAEDVAKIIPVAANIGGIYNLTDGYHPSFFELSKLIACQLNKKEPKNIPLPVAVLIAKLGNSIKKLPLNSYTLNKITSELTFDDSKARKLLNWNPNHVLNKFKIY